MKMIGRNRNACFLKSCHTWLLTASLLSYVPMFVGDNYSLFLLLQLGRALLTSFLHSLLVSYVFMFLDDNFSLFNCYSLEGKLLASLLNCSHTPSILWLTIVQRSPQSLLFFYICIFMLIDDNSSLFSVLQLGKALLTSLLSCSHNQSI